MRPSELETMYRLEDTYWWFVARRELVMALVRRFASAPGPLTILDVGCGTGATLKELSSLGQAIGLDLAEDALSFCRSRCRTHLARGSAESLPFASNTLDLVTVLDVLEHLEDDGTALREIARVLRPGGEAVLTVPAFPMLWSEHDEALDHKRRYRARSFRRLIAQAGLQVEFLSHAIFLVFAPTVAFRLVQRWMRDPGRRPQTALISLPGWCNQLLVRVLRLEGKVLVRAPLPIGVSLVAVVRKGRDDGPRHGPDQLCGTAL